MPKKKNLKVGKKLKKELKEKLKKKVLKIRNQLKEILYLIKKNKIKKKAHQFLN